MMVRGLATVLLIASTALAWETDDGVTVGTDKNFQDIITENEYVLAEFYAPWCGHCKQLAPEYAAASKTLKEQGSEALLVKVDATEHEKLAEEYQVQGFPTIKFFKKGIATEYGGGRTADAIVAWIKKKTGPAAVPVDSVDASDKMKEENPVLVFGFFESETSPEAKAFVEAADVSELAYAISTNADVAKSNGVEAMPKIVVLTDFDEKRYEYEGEYNAADIGAFCSASSLPLVIEFSEEAAPKIFGGEIKSHYLLFADHSGDDFAGQKAEFSKAAKTLKGKLMFITLDISQEPNKRILEFFGITEEQCPTYRIINVTEDMAKFAPESGDLTEAAFTKFGEEYTAGTLKRHMMAEDVPDDWDAQPVKVLTGKNFDEVAKSGEKDVFVEFYAPWCGHCKQLAPIFDKLGAAYEGIDTVVIAKMDSTANEISDVSVQGFPTLKLFKKDGTIVDFDGERTLKPMAEFIAENTGTEVPEEVANASDEEPPMDEGMGAGEGESHDEL